MTIKTIDQLKQDIELVWYNSGNAVSTGGYTGGGFS
jgi:hypothetical protein